MSNKLTRRDFKGEELDPNATWCEALAFVARIASWKLKGKQIVEDEASSSKAQEEDAKPRKGKKRKPSSDTTTRQNDSEKKMEHLNIPNAEWIRLLTEKKNKRRKKHEANAPPPPPLPEEFEAHIVAKCGGSRPEKIIHFYQKTLFATDVNKHHCRLFMSLYKLETFEFLKDEEVTHLRQEGTNIQVPLIHKPIDDISGEPLPLTEKTITFKQWDLHKLQDDPLKMSSQYVFDGTWNEIVWEDKLRKGHTIDVWAFRDVEDKLCMALSRRE